ncbi:MAG: OmpA family protein [Fluviicola sp.]
MIPRINLFMICLFLSLFSSAQESMNRVVYFRTDSYQLDQRSCDLIDSISEQLKGKTAYTVQLIGHTDNVGTNGYNDALSKNRVVAVQNRFVSNSIPQDQVAISQFGELQPVKENESQSGRAQNRRVEIRVIIQADLPAITEEPIVEKAPQWPPIDAIVVDYNQQTYQLPGYKPGNTVDIDVITNTAQMEFSNFTTITNNQELLTSNLMFCCRPSGRTTNCFPPKPVKVYIPVNRKAYCEPAEAFLYDAVLDSVTGRTVWKQVPSDFTIEEHNNIKYFVIYLKNLCGPCKNFDCKIPKSTPIKVKLKSRRFELTKVSGVYPETNGLLPGQAYDRNRYFILSYDREVPEVPFISLKGKTKTDKYFGLNVKLNSLKQDKNEIYIVKKKLIRKSKPRKLTDEERKKQLENPVGEAPAKG